jgi:L-ascorbate metabolism protein UlaG (beta-lactamase superfamily)
LDFSWLGHACVRIRTSGGSVLMDPVDRESGYDMGRPNADIVTVSRPDAPHSNVKGVRGEFTLLDAPGEYEIKGVHLAGITTTRPRTEEDAPLDRTTLFVLEADDLRVAHLGGLGWPLTAEQAEALGSVDVLIIPLGGGPALDATAAARLVREIDPRIVIPMHYVPDEADLPPQDFIKAVGMTPEEPVQRAMIHRRGLGDTTRLVVLQLRG